jgi:hypothetical protein
MRKLLGSVIIALAASTAVAVAPLFLSFAKSEPALRGAKFAQVASRREVGTSFRQPGHSAPSLNAKQRSHSSKLAWRDGHWRKGRIGWWWVVGGIWYFYPEPIDGPPDYVSDVAVDDEMPPSQPPQSKKPSQTRGSGGDRLSDRRGMLAGERCRRRCWRLRHQVAHRCNVNSRAQLLRAHNAVKNFTTRSIRARTVAVQNNVS